MPCRAFEQLFEGRKYFLWLSHLLWKVVSFAYLGVFFFPPSPKETLPHFLRLGMWLGLLWGFWACSSHSPLVFDSMIRSSFNFTVHSSEISLKGNLTQSVLSEVRFVIHFGCCQSVIWLTFLHLHIVKKNWCGLIKIKGGNVWNPWTLWIHRNFLEHTKA